MTREVLSRWRSRDAIVLEDAPIADRAALEALRDAQVLIPTSLRHRAPPAPIDPAAVALATLVLEVAQTCNLRCTYCYAGGGSYGGAPRLMRPELARRAARHLVESSGEREQVTLVLFGGEPLLNFPAIEAAVSAAEAAADAAGKALVVSLTTNGTRFTPEALDFLREHRVGISVSIDGPPDVHDANRRFPGRAGGGTYADVVQGLTMMRAHGCRPPAARVTLTPDQWGRVPEVFEHVLGLGVLEVGIAPASPVDAGLLPTPEQDEALFAGFASIAERFARAADAGRVLPFSNLLDLLARLHLGQVKGAPCGAGLGYLALDASWPLLSLPPVRGRRCVRCRRSRFGRGSREDSCLPFGPGGTPPGSVRRVLGEEPLRRRLPLREPSARGPAGTARRRILRVHPALARARHSRLRRSLPRSRQPGARLSRAPGRELIPSV